MRHRDIGEREFRHRYDNERGHQHDGERGQLSREPSVAPGKRTLTQNLRGPEPARMFELAAETPEPVEWVARLR